MNEKIVPGETAGSEPVEMRLLALEGLADKAAWQKRQDEVARRFETGGWVGEGDGAPIVSIRPPADSQE